MKRNNVFEKMSNWCRLKLGYLVALIMLLVACNGKNELADDLPPLLYIEPIIVPLNTTEGYKINKVTGDSILPIIGVKGDTVVTGKPLSIIGRHIQLQSLAKPQALKIGQPKKVDAIKNSFPIKDGPLVIKIDTSGFTPLIPNQVVKPFVLTNLKGDTIPTGMDIHVIGKPIRNTEGPPISALPFKMKDNAIVNLQYLISDQGEQGNAVSSIFEDRRGLLWLGSRYKGFSRYDGTTFLQYNSQFNGGASSIIDDEFGDLWIAISGQQGGLLRYDGASTTQYGGIEMQGRTKMYKDNSGGIWYPNVSGGVARIEIDNINKNEATITHVTTNEGLISNNVLCIFEDHLGKVWFGTDIGITIFNPKDGKKGSFHHLSKKEGLPDYRISGITEDKSGIIWFVMSDQFGGNRKPIIARFDGNFITAYKLMDILGSNEISGIHADDFDRLWLTSGEGGVVEFDPLANFGNGSFSQYSESEGLSHNEIISVWEDSGGNMLFGTDGGGVNRFHPNSFINFGKKEAVFDWEVNSIIEDGGGNLWFGTDGGGIQRYDGKSFYKYTKETGLPSNYIWSMKEDSKGNIWVGTFYGGFSQLKGETIRNYPEPTARPFNSVFSILEDQNGYLWFASWLGGIWRFDGNEYILFTTKEGFPNNTVNCTLQDRQGNLWFGSNGGASRYDPLANAGNGSFTHYTDREGMVNNEVRAILEDKNGNIWFGTNGGLSVFDGSSFKHYVKKSGLTSNNIMSLQQDDDGSIWVGTDNGLNHIVFDGLFESDNNWKSDVVSSDSVSIYTYGIEEGLKEIALRPNSVLKDSKDNLWWGSGKSVLKLDANRLTVSSRPPKVHLTQLELEDQFIDYHNKHDQGLKGLTFDNTANYFNYPIHVTIPYNRNHLTFHFVGIDWAAPRKIKYSYKLVGLDEKWSQPSMENKAVYRNIPNGKYTLNIRAIGESNVWSDPFLYSFTISPPWWFSSWAYAMYGLLFIACVRLVHNIQKKRVIRLEQAKMQQKELAQAKEIEKAYGELKSTQAQLIQSEKMASLGELTAGIAHEIQNPLNFVNNFSEVNKELLEELDVEATKGNLAEVKDLAKDIKANEEKINHHGKRADAIVKGMLQHSRSSSGVKEPTDLNALADEYLRLAYHGLRAKDKGFNATMKTDFDTAIGTINVVPQEMGRVILNLITNAFYAVNERSTFAKASEEDYEPTVWVSTKKDKDQITISVRDNGNGIPKAVLDKIFQPFFTTKPTGEGTGLGLSMSYDIVKAHEGDLQVATKEGVGTEFIIHMPI